MSSALACGKVSPTFHPLETMTVLTGKTLCIDIGGSGIKGMVLCPQGLPLVERYRLPTPRPANPAAVLDTVEQLAQTLGAFDRISVGFPGVVDQGVVRTGANLDGAWAGMPLAQAISDRSPSSITSQASPQISVWITGPCRSRKGIRSGSTPLASSMSAPGFSPVAICVSVDR